jgi:hydrogenase expression/formation protein HypD
MKHVDDYRRPEHCERLLEEIRRTATQPWTLMEVCGGQTHGLLRYGIDAALEDAVRLIHGPGCPVCVTPAEAIDNAIELARRPNITVTSFGDMLRVPGSRESLLQARAEGGNVRIVYSPLDAVRFAQEHPERDVVFFAVGFETTAPTTALAVHQAAKLGLKNFSLLVSHVRVQPAMEMLAGSDDCAVDGFLAAGHVCTVAGYESYVDFAATYHMPVVVTGFEPVDLLSGILECVRQLEHGEARVANCYGRSVAAAGNREALAIVDDVYENCDRPWRGLGVIRGGGFQLREKWAQFDAERAKGIGSVYSRPVPGRRPSATVTLEEQQVLHRGESELFRPAETAGLYTHDSVACECRSGEVLTGRIRPTECEHFGNRCTPESPLGAPMVSAEGACAAYYRYAPNRGSVKPQAM